ncbi:MAG: CPBP family intramembrane glutamic endopeptidase [Terrimicrobiaceae bacterium]|nr:CPBP family intramembrane glutamic endopeptidase [Terrimicrobiaceae bacterium]
MNPGWQTLAYLLPAVVTAFFLPRIVRYAFAGIHPFPPTRWAWPEAVLTGAIAGFFLLMAFLSAGAEKVQVTLGSVLMSMFFYSGIALFLIGFLVMRGRNPVEAFGLNWRAWRTEAVLVPAALLVAMPFIVAAQWLAYQISGPETTPQPIVTFLLENPGWRERLAVAAVAIVVAPLVEELIYRGCVYGICRQYVGRIPALVFSAVVFAVIHGHAPSLVGLFVLAVALTLLYERTGSLWAPIALHAVFNSLTIAAAILWPDLGS